MFETIDLYCERIGAGFFAEPVNAFTNIAFLVMAGFAWRNTNQLQTHSKEVELLITLMVLIGLGSGLFHTYANGLTRILDIVPILLFQLLYLWVYMRRVIRIRQSPATGILLSYFVVAMIGRQFPHLLNGSLIYAPTVLALIAIGIYHMITQSAGRYLVLIAAGIFSISLLFRTIDETICESFSLGTHFMWHICNAIMLYFLVTALLVYLNSHPEFTD